MRLWSCHCFSIFPLPHRSSQWAPSVPKVDLKSCLVKHPIQFAFASWSDARPKQVYLYRYCSDRTTCSEVAVIFASKELESHRASFPILLIVGHHRLSQSKPQRIPYMPSHLSTTCLFRRLLLHLDLCSWCHQSQLSFHLANQSESTVRAFHP